MLLTIKSRDQRGGESNLALDVSEKSMYGFLVSEAMGAVLLKTTQSKN